MKNNVLTFIICFFLFVTSGFVIHSVDAGSSQSVVITAHMPLINSNIKSTEIGSENVTIIWNTSHKTDSTVEYGTTSGYGSTKTDSVKTTTHSIKLTQLTSFTKYYYRIISTVDGVTNTSDGYTFTTTHPVGTVAQSKTADTTITGVDVNTTSGGKQQVNISTSGLTTTHDATSVTVTAPADSGWKSIKYVGSVATATGSLTVTDINSVVMSTKPVETDLGGNIGTASAQIDVPLTKPVSGVAVEQKIIQGATTDTTNAFQLAAASSNLDIKSVAYTVKFENTANLNANLGSAGVTLNLGVSHDWVEANGGRDKIKVFRFGDDGTKEVLSTTYTGSSGSTDNFQAISYKGLSTFGMTAVASTISGGDDNGGGGNTGGGSTGSTGTGGYAATSEGPAVASHASSPVQQALAPVVQEIGRLLAPFQEPTVSTRPISVTGMTVTTKPSGIQTVSIAKGLAEKSGAGVSVYGNVITVRQPDFILTITTSTTPEEENGVISGTASSVELATDPVPASIGIGTVSFSLDTALASVPDNAVITTTVTETIDPGVLNAYQRAAANAGRQVQDVAYSVEVGKTGLTSAGPATVTLTVPPDWVMSRGGTRSIAIAHLADDGTADLLAAEYSGLDKTGAIIFTATSPKGLSSFSLVSMKDMPATTVAGTGETRPVSTPAPTPQKSGVFQEIAGVTGKLVSNNSAAIVVIVAIMIAIGSGIVLYDRRPGTKKKQRKNE